MIWKDGKKYLVKVINPVFGNFGKVVEVEYKYYNGNAFVFYCEETDNCDEEFYCEYDFKLVDEKAVQEAVDEWIEKNREFFNDCNKEELVREVFVELLLKAGE